MKTYEITRSTASGEIVVLVKTDDGRDAAILKHVVLHSPTGMETGYGGSGPADLALSIVADFLGVVVVIERPLGLATRGDFTKAKEALLFHQGFKWHFIAARKIGPGRSYEIRGDEIEAWLRDARAGAAMAPDAA